jgi:hypothetical protein
MNIFRRMARPVALSVILSLAGLSIEMPAYGAIIGTDTAISAEKSGLARDKINTMLARADVQQELLTAGVSPDQVSARVAAMTDTEVASLSGKLDKMTAGGDALGIALFVFLLLVLTDLLGYTNIFPFTKKGSLKH